MFIIHLGGSSMMLQWVPLCAYLSLFVLICVCVHSPCLCLYIPCVNRVASSCPWISIDRECGICWVFLSISLCERAGGGFVGHNKVTQWQAALHRYLWLFWPNVEVWVATLQRHSIQWSQITSQGERKFFFKTGHSLLGGKNMLKLIFIIKKEPGRV